jgi:hypothetical protein
MGNGGTAVEILVDFLRACAYIIHTLCLPESAIAALSSVNVPRHASLLRLALTHSFCASCTNNLCTVPKWREIYQTALPELMNLSYPEIVNWI